MSKPPNRCVYCGLPGVTKEHIWGAWSRKHAPAKFPRNEHILERYHDFDIRGAKSSRKGHLDRPGTTRSQTMKIACGQCNSGWMKANVDAAIPTLTRMNYGYWGKITDYEAATLTRWIAQFSMSFEFADRDTVMIPQSVRTEFSKTNQLTGNWVIAIGVAMPVTGKEPAFHRALGLTHTDGETEPVQVTAFMFGMLLAVSFYSHFPTPSPVFSAISDMKLSVIFPLPSNGVVRPTWRHSEETVPIVVDAITAALSKWAETRGET